MSSLIDRFDRFVFDLDGTLWRSGDLLPHAERVLAELRRRDKTVAFITNSPVRSCATVAAQLRAGGVAADEREVVTSGRTVSHYLSQQGLDRCRAFLIGEPGLRQNLEHSLDLEILDVNDGNQADVVVVGYDESISFAKLRTAFQAILAGARFVATNRDRVYPVADGLWPASGTIVVGLAYATKVTPVVVGKPERPMLDLTATLLGPLGPTLLVGDKPDADIESARRMSWSGALVLTGATAKTDHFDPAPDFVLADLSELLAAR